MLGERKRELLRDGLVIPAHPLALAADGSYDAARQAALTDYYLDAGVGGLAVGVHTTQFEIHDPAVGLYEPVLASAAERAAQAGRDVLMIAGVLGPTANAVAEARLAADLGYDLALVATPGWGDAPESEILDGVAAIGEVLPVFGFYLQELAARRRFGYRFWRAYAEISSVAAIKIAPFDRYATLDVVRAVVDAGRAGGTGNDIALYTGNDDNIVADLLTPLRFDGVTVRIVGGLLGQWATWPGDAVRLHRRLRDVVAGGGPIPAELLTVGAELTDVNAAVFDVAHRFAGGIAGVNEVLRRAGVLHSARCLDPAQVLSPGQAQELDRVTRAYPHLCSR